MQLTTLLIPFLAAGTMASPPPWRHGGRPGSSSSSSSSSSSTSAPTTCTLAPVPVSTCLTDVAATSLAESFRSMLTNVDRAAANATGQLIIAEGYSEDSDSILSLQHQPLGTVTFFGKQTYLTNVIHAPPIANMTTLDVIHDCSKIVWFWHAQGLGSGRYPVKGVNIMYTTNNGTQVLENKVEFNSLAWGADIFNTAVNLNVTL